MHCKCESKVDSVYNNLTFSGVDFPVTGIKLHRVPYGIAFARFEPKINQRTVLFNYAYFYEKYWKAAKADSTRHNIRDMISGVLAHEWAHHYMGHTFERNTIIKERDADIMAGRVMYENLINDPVNDNIGLNLKRSLLTIKVLENAPQSAYHLSANAREGLIRKGFITGLIIHYKKKGGVCPLIQKLVDAKIASLESLTGLAQNTLCKETKQQAQAALEARKDIPNSLKEKIYISDCYSFSSTAILPDSIKQLSIKLTTQFKNQYDSLWRIRKISILKPFLISDAISQDMVQNYIINPAPGSTIGIETESIYNLLYNGQNTNTLRCTPNLTVTIPKSFTTHKAKADTDSILTYTLQYGAALLHGYVGSRLTALGIPNLVNRFKQVALS